MGMVLGATLYLNDSVAALDFYCQAFGMTLGYHQKNAQGTYLHAELEKDGRSIFAVSESGDLIVPGQMLSAVQPTMSLGINFPNDAQLLHAYHSLVEGGHILRPLGSVPWSPLSADVVDRFGVCWYLYVSQNRPEESEEHFPVPRHLRCQNSVQGLKTSGVPKKSSDGGRFSCDEGGNSSDDPRISSGFVQKSAPRPSKQPLGG